MWVQVYASDPNLTQSAYSSLPMLIQSKLEALFSTHLVARNELDAKCFLELRQLPETVLPSSMHALLDPPALSQSSQLA